MRKSEINHIKPLFISVSYYDWKQKKKKRAEWTGYSSVGHLSKKRKKKGKSHDIPSFVL